MRAVEFLTGQPYTVSVQGERGRWRTEKRTTVPPMWWVGLGFVLGVLVVAVGLHH